jgi:phosphate:Na+ symporter
VVRDLKRIDAHLAATAYPLLERTGVLKPTRLAS